MKRKPTKKQLMAARRACLEETEKFRKTIPESFLQADPYMGIVGYEKFMAERRVGR